MDPFIGLLIIVLVAKAAVDKGRREYRATREQHAAQIARNHPDWHPRKVSRSAGRRTMSHWWNELAAWPPFPSMRAAFAEEQMTAKVAREEARADGVVRWKELHERLQRALAAQSEHRDGAADAGQPPPDPAATPALPAAGVGLPKRVRFGNLSDPDVSLDDIVPGTGRLGAGPEPQPRPDARPDDSSWLEPHEERCEGCGGTGGNADGTDACPVCRGFGSKPPDPDAPPWWHGTVCRACGRPGTTEDPVVSASQIHRSHVVEAQARYQDALARLHGTGGAEEGHGPYPRRPVRSYPGRDDGCPGCGELPGNPCLVGCRCAACTARNDDTAPGPREEDLSWNRDPFPEAEPDDWPTGVPHRRNGDAPSPATNGGTAMPTGTDTPIDTSLENADTPHEAMQGAFRQIGARAAEFAQAASDELAAAAAVHGMDRDPQTMSDISALADHAQALQAQANAAATGLASRHADGAEYHSTGTDAHASAYRPT